MMEIGREDIDQLEEEKDVIFIHSLHLLCASLWNI